MKIEVETVDGFLINVESGKAKSAEVLRVRWQKAPRKPYETANIIVDNPDPSTALEAVAAWLRQKQTAKP